MVTCWMAFKWLQTERRIEIFKKNAVIIATIVIINNFNNCNNFLHCVNARSICGVRGRHILNKHLQSTTR